MPSRAEDPPLAGVPHIGAPVKDICLYSIRPLHWLSASCGPLVACYHNERVTLAIGDQSSCRKGQKGRVR